ncbi:thiamine phosphate synthase [Peribacillus kribbensis]|uniref:thiamine phosphate synthase n=1 Tax=Peribacillus kribbensis TaxID=356658 RepID=UPI000411C1FE|nr:thiamine phosphate synthase [Peribacillus kribbensis]
MIYTSQEIRKLLKVYFIMGSTNCFKDPKEVLEEAIKGGITLFQFREKGTGALQGEEKLTLAKELQAICKENSIPFIINDDLDLALTLDADGIHIGQDDGDIVETRKLIGDDKILGVSVHSEEEAVLAKLSGADYFGIGPVFPTSTKEDAKPARGSVLIEELLKREIHVPIVGIGGITPANAGTVMASGADGVSVITAISHADSPLQTARELKSICIK